MLNRKGFTLIEILIVVAIIALLAGIVLVGLGPAQKGAADVRRVAEVNQIQTALEAYRLRNGSYPADEATFDTIDGVNQLGNPPKSLNKTIGYAYDSASSNYILGVGMDGGVPPNTQSSNEIRSGNGPGSAGGTCGTDTYCVTGVGGEVGSSLTCSPACVAPETCQSVSGVPTCQVPAGTACTAWSSPAPAYTTSTGDVYSCTCTIPPGGTPTTKYALVPSGSATPGFCNLTTAP